MQTHFVSSRTLATVLLHTQVGEVPMQPGQEIVAGCEDPVEGQEGGEKDENDPSPPHFQQRDIQVLNIATGFLLHTCREKRLKETPTVVSVLK